MEYFALILNRTFVVFIAPEGLYGYKAIGPVTTAAPLFFEPLVDMLKDPELMHDKEAVKQLSELKGGFFIPRSDIAAVEVIPTQKWGMGPIPHSGRIRVSLSSGQSREFILLGIVDGEAVRQRILSG
jgi:hypothetical protein